MLLASWMLSHELLYGVELKNSERRPTDFMTIRQLMQKFPRENVEKYLRDFIKSGNPNRMAGQLGHLGAKNYLLGKLSSISKVAPAGLAGTSNVVVDEFIPDIDWAIKKYESDFNQKVAGKYPIDDPVYKVWNTFTLNIKETLRSLKEVKGSNLIWEKQGYKNPQQVLAIGAYYDSVAMSKESYMVQLGQAIEGADNNGSGVSILLSMAELFSQMEFPFTIRLIFFDFGEFQSLGALSYAKKYLEDAKERASFLGYIDLLMLGHDSLSTDKQKKNGNMKLYLRGKLNAGYKQDSNLADKLVAAGKMVHPGIRFTPMPNDFDVSGHLHFWDKGVAALLFSQDWEDDSNEVRNHTPDDFVESLNLKTLSDAFYYIAGSVISFANNVTK